MKLLTRIISLLLATVSLSFPISVSAVTQERTLIAKQLVGETLQLSGIEYWDDTLYFVNKDSLYVLDEGSDAPVVFSLANVINGMNRELSQVQLLRGKNALYLLNVETGLLHSLDISEETPKASNHVQLEWDDYFVDLGDGNHFVNAPSNFCLADGHLYAIEQDAGNRIVAFDINSGMKITFQSSRVEAFTPYKGGKLLVLAHGAASNTQSDEREIGIFDPQKDVVKSVRPITEGDAIVDNIFGFQYDMETDILYIGVNHEIIRYPQLQSGEPCTIIPPIQLAQDALRLAGGDYCIVASNAAVFFRALNPNEMNAKKTLTIWGTINSPAVSTAVIALDHVNVLMVEGDKNDTIEQRLIGRDNEVDIFHVSVSTTDFTALLKKGYFDDLSENQTIVTLHSDLYPFVQQSLEIDGKIAAIPIDAHLQNVDMYDTGFFADTESAIPSTFAEICTLIQDWSKLYMEQHPEFAPLDGYEGTRNLLIRAAIDLYWDHMLRSNESMTFDSPMLRNMLDMAERAALATGSAESDPEAYRSPVISLGEYTSITSFHGDGRDGRTLKPMMISTDDTSLAPLALSIEVLLVNPRSGNKELAIQFLENVVSAIPITVRMMLCPDENQPLMNSNYEEVLQYLKDTLAAVTQQVEVAEGAERTNAEKLLDNQERRIEQYIKTEQYALTVQDIAAYREAMDGAFVDASGFRNNLDAALRGIVNRYIDGQIEREQFIQEAEGKLRLILNENK